MKKMNERIVLQISRSQEVAQAGWIGFWATLVQMSQVVSVHG